MAVQATGDGEGGVGLHEVLEWGLSITQYPMAWSLAIRVCDSFSVSRIDQTAGDLHMLYSQENMDKAENQFVIL